MGRTCPGSLPNLLARPASRCYSGPLSEIPQRYTVRASRSPPLLLPTKGPLPCVRQQFLVQPLLWDWLSGLSRAKARAQGSPPFDGIQVNLGNIFRTSTAQTRSISAENPTGREGAGCHGDKGHRRACCPGTGTGLEGVAVRHGATQYHHHPGGDRRPWGDPTDVDRRPAHREHAVLHPPLLLGRRERALGGSAHGRPVRLRLGKVLPDQLVGGVRQPGQRAELLLAHALPQEGEDHPRKSSTTVPRSSATRSTTCSPRCPRMPPISTPSSAASTSCR